MAQQILNMQHRKFSLKGRTPKEFVEAIAQHRFWERENFIQTH
jgi:hypothetical protein